MTSYTELHCHSCYSLREGASTPEELVLRARELGYDALAVFRRIREERGVTILMATHDMHVAGISDRVVYMRDGRIVEDGAA